MSRENISSEELKCIIDESVEKAFKKYGKKGLSIKLLLIGVFLIIGLIVCIFFIQKRNTSEKVQPVENHDLTLENNGILGFTAADFEEAILGETTRQKLLIVEEQEAYVNTTITDTGLFNLGFFNREQALTIHGTGQYTIDLTQITPENIQLNEETYELTIQIPHAVLHNTSFDPGKTEIGDTKNGWLAFGDIELNQEQHKQFETEAVQKLQEKLNERERFEEADRFAKLSAYETYQPVVKSVSPAYKVVIVFQERVP